MLRFLARPVIVLFTVNENETQAVLHVFQSKRSTLREKTKEGITYIDLGLHGKQKIILCITEMGAGGIGAAQARASASIKHWQPKALIAVGIAFGMDETKQSIGDVLISKQLQPYELSKVKEDGVVIPRDDKATSSDKLLSRFRTTNANQHQASSEGWPTIQFGLLLSGLKLIDSLDYRESLKDLFQEAIGGEMEGAGVYTSAQTNKVDWIIVKSICDWGYKKGNENKEEWQKVAAKNAAAVVHKAVDSPIYDTPRIPFYLYLAFAFILTFFAWYFIDQPEKKMDLPISDAIVEVAEDLKVGIVFKRSALDELAKPSDGKFLFRVSTRKDGLDDAKWVSFSPTECEISFSDAISDYLESDPQIDETASKIDLVNSLEFWGQISSRNQKGEDRSAPFRFKISPGE